MGIGELGWDEPDLSCGALSAAVESDAFMTGWRAYVAPDPEEEPEGEMFMFCPKCSEREFGPLGWEAGSLVD